MNLIVNFIICFIILYLFFLSFINTNIDDNPIKYKLYIFSIITFIQMSINLSEIINNNCEFNIMPIIKKSILYGLFSIIGYSIYIDFNLFLFTDLFNQYNDIKYYKFLLMTSIIILISFIFATLDIIITNNIIIDCKKNEEYKYI
jgi:hypothetical protein